MLSIKKYSTHLIIAALSLITLLLTVFLGQGCSKSNNSGGGGGGGALPDDSSKSLACKSGTYIYAVLNNGTSGNELYKSNGEAECTTMVQDLTNNGDSSYSDDSQWDLGNGRIFFLANDNINGFELWKYDSGGASLVKNIEPDGDLDILSSKTVETINDYRSGVVLNNRLYFVIKPKGGTLNELWVSDGTDSGTYSIHSANSIGQLIEFQGNILFSSKTGSLLSYWKTDGSISGTAQFSTDDPFQPFKLSGDLYYISNFTDIVKISGSNLETSVLSTFTAGSLVRALVVNNQILVSVRSPEGSKLFVTDGVSAPSEIALLNTKNNIGINIYPSNIAGNSIFIVTQDDADNYVIWKSDGTPGGTKKYSLANTNSSPNARYFTEYKGKFYFQANDGVNGQELWVMDSDSVSLIDIEVGTASLAMDLLVYNNLLYFFAFDTVNGFQLWQHDGVYASRVSDTFTSYYYRGLNSLVEHNNRLFFIGSDIFGSELWTSDGTTAGTDRVTDLNNKGNALYRYGSLDKFDNKLFFLANDGVHGNEFWLSDGTASNTKMISDINQGNKDTSFDLFFSIGVNKYIIGTDNGGTALFKIETDSLMEIKRIPGDGGGGFSVEHNGFVYFNIGYSNGVDGIWRTDGTSENTTRVLDAATMNTVSSLRVNGLSSYNNNLYFLAHHLLDGFGLYQLNTNDFSVSIVKTINPNGTNQTREGIIVRLNKMIFKAEAAKGEMETWVSDGTADGTKVLFDPYLSAGNSTDLLATNSTHLFFRGWDGVENKIWKSDAISAFPLETPFQVFSAIAHNDVVYFLGKDMVSLLSGLYNFDGSRFVLLKSFVGNNLYEIISHKGKMYFSMVQTGVDSESVTQLWVSDGTEAGTRILKSISKVASEDGIWGLSSSGDGHFYFILDDVDHGEELWVSDGTEAGTHIVVDLNPGIAKGTGSNPMKLIRQYDP